MIFIRLLWLALGIYGFRCAYRRQKSTALSLGLACFFLLALILLGGHLDGLHSARLIFPFFLFTGALSTFALAHLLRANLPRRRRLARLGGLLLAGLLCWWLPSYRQLFVFYADQGVAKSSFTEMVSRQPLADLERVSGWLKDQGDDARIFVESSKYVDNLQYLIQRGSGRATISGPYNYIFFRQNFANFQLQFLVNAYFSSLQKDYRFLAQPVVPPAAFAEFASLYNVRWFVVTDEALVKNLQSSLPPEKLRLAEVCGIFKIFLLDIPNTYFVHGSGQLTADETGIHLSQVQPDETFHDVIIKFNWLADLIASDGSPVNPYFLPMAPQGLIQVQNPSADFSLSLR